MNSKPKSRKGRHLKYNEPMVRISVYITKSQLAFLTTGHTLADGLHETIETARKYKEEKDADKLSE